MGTSGANSQSPGARRPSRRAAGRAHPARHPLVPTPAASQKRRPGRGYLGAPSGTRAGPFLRALVGVAAWIRVGVGVRVPPPSEPRLRLRRPEAPPLRPRMRLRSPPRSARVPPLVASLARALSALGLSALRCPPLEGSGRWWSSLLRVHVLDPRCLAHAGCLQGDMRENVYY